MYQVHDFSHNRLLNASELNNMETQIAANEITLSNQMNTVNSTENVIQSIIEDLDIVTDGAYICLQYNGNNISTAYVPSNMDFYVAPDSISLTPSTSTITKGSSENLSVSVLPVDTSLKIRLYSSDTEVARILRDGTVKGVGFGTAIVTAKCGNLQQTATINVDEIIKPSIGYLSYWVGYDAGDLSLPLAERESMYVIYQTGELRFFTMPPEAGFVIPPNT